MRPRLGLALSPAARRVPSFDGSELLAGWNGTCLQRHVQAVRMERQLAAAALVGAGLDVLLCDATAVFLREPVSALRAAPEEVDVLLQRDDWPVSPLGASANAGFVYLRGSFGAARAADVVRLVSDVVRRGMIEFYLRWNNIVDQYGWTHTLASLRLDAPQASRATTGEFVNETTLGSLKRRGCSRRVGSRCLRVGLLPYDEFPRHGDWRGLSGTARIHHLTGDGCPIKAGCGVRPFRGLRQRLNRYDDVDFTEMRATLQGIGAWVSWPFAWPPS